MSGINRRKALRRLGVAATAGIAGLAGCSGGDGGDGGSDGSDGGDGGDGGSMEGGPDLDLTIACPTSLSGPFAPYGQAELDGGRLAAQHLQEEFSNISIEIVSDDTQVDPSRAVDLLERMVVDEGANFAFGGVSSAVGIAMGSWGTENKVPVLPHGASDAITGAECSKFMFSTYSHNTMQASVVAPEMAKRAEEWYLLWSDYTWGKTANEVVTQGLEDNGATVIGSEAVPFPNDDYTSYLNTVRNADPDGVGLLVAGLDQRTSMSQVLDLGIAEDFVIGMQQLEDIGIWGLNKQAAAAIDICSQGWSPALDTAKDWKAEVQEFSEVDPFVRHYMGYTSVDQLVRAAVRAESTDGNAIVDQLEGHEIQSERVREIQPAESLFWRAEDHQLVQPVYASTGREVSEMQDDPYKIWWDVVNTVPGKEAAGEPFDSCQL